MKIRWRIVKCGVNNICENEIFSWISAVRHTRRSLGEVFIVSGKQRRMFPLKSSSHRTTTNVKKVELIVYISDLISLLFRSSSSKSSCRSPVASFPSMKCCSNEFSFSTRSPFRSSNVHLLFLSLSHAYHVKYSTLNVAEIRLRKFMSDLFHFFRMKSKTKLKQIKYSETTRNRLNVRQR